MPALPFSRISQIESPNVFDMRLSNVGQTDCLDQLSDAGEPRLHVLGEVGKLAVYRVVECFDSPSHIFDYTMYGIIDFEAMLKDLKRRGK